MKKKSESCPADKVVKLEAATEVRIICLQLVLLSVVSFRSVPRILQQFKRYTGLNWIPHFSSVINWSLRLGLGVLKQVRPRSPDWLAIIDHSIAIGTRKVLVVLRVPLETLLQKRRALCFEDCECIGLTVSEKVTGESIATELRQIFERSGRPCGIIKDNESGLNKGVRLWMAEAAVKVALIEDIGHTVARALKADLTAMSQYSHFTRLLTQIGTKLRQTEFAFLLPPKLRRKGRFQSISHLGRWGERLLGLFRDGMPEALKQRVQGLAVEFNQLAPFLEHLAQHSHLTSQILKILKHRGLDDNTANVCRVLLKQLPDNSRVRVDLEDWLQRHLLIQAQLIPKALPVSSDIIESLFGKFKQVMARCPQADMNQLVLLIPALCGAPEADRIVQILSQTTHQELQQWKQDNLSCTMQQQRRQLLGADHKYNPKTVANIISN